jgi:PEP-CTERM motif-containing protein
LDWAAITDGTMGEDYWLEYCSTGDLAGYTMLTVGAVPEPSAVALMVIGLGTLLMVRRRQ